MSANTIDTSFSSLLNKYSSGTSASGKTAASTEPAVTSAASSSDSGTDSEQKLIDIFSKNPRAECNYWRDSMELDFLSNLFGGGQDDFSGIFGGSGAAKAAEAYYNAKLTAAKAAAPSTAYTSPDAKSKSKIDTAA